MTDPLAPFAPGILAESADETGVAASSLRALLERQQRLVRDFPDMAVEGLVHDWRTAFAEDPLVCQDDRAYYLSVPEHVWRDLIDRLDLSETEATALRTANSQQFEAAVGEPADKHAVVLAK